MADTDGILAAGPPAHFEAQVVASFGRSLIVRGADGRERRARPPGGNRQRTQQIVCGDRVSCRHDADTDELHVLLRLPRRTVLERSTGRGAVEPVAANLDLLVVVIAPAPQPDWFVADRYLCAAACAGLQGLLVLNKMDMGTVESLLPEVQWYQRIGYPVLQCETRSAQGAGPLAAALQQRIAALVGQSGVGKSSLIRALATQGDDIVTGVLAREGGGRHTTTASRLYDCVGGGALIDSPGVRDYAPSLDRLDPASLGFIEIEQRAAACRFQDCGHLREPDCAVRAALAAGQMHARRYESYRRMRRLFEELTTARAPR